MRFPQCAQVRIPWKSRSKLEARAPRDKRPAGAFMAFASNFCCARANCSSVTTPRCDARCDFATPVKKVYG